MKKYFFLILVSVIAVPFAQAQPVSPMDHLPGMEGIRMGKIEGTLFVQEKEGKKTPLPNHKMAIVVFKDGQRILMLDKTTDASGHYVFKNIFRDPSFMYALGALYEGTPYILSPLQLEADQESLTADFPVGSGSPYRVEGMPDAAPEGGPGANPDAAMPPSPESVEASFSVPSAFSQPYQKIAVILSLGVVLLGLYFGFSPRTRY